MLLADSYIYFNFFIRYIEAYLPIYTEYRECLFKRGIQKYILTQPPNTATYINHHKLSVHFNRTILKQEENIS